MTTATTAAARGPWLHAAWVVAIVATLGSLWFSEVRGFVPCTLCWYQRVLMYPLVWWLGAAAWRADRALAALALPLALLGLGVAGYHYAEQMVPGFGAPGLCASGVPCSARYIAWGGVVTIPFLSGSAFLLIATGLGLALRRPSPRAPAGGAATS